MYYMEWLILSATAAFIFYKWATKSFKIFKERGIKFGKPWPIMGNAASMLGGEAFHKMILRVYRDSKAHKVYGFFNFREPLFIIQDPDLIKKITIKDFESFPNRTSLESNDSFVGSLLTMMKDQRWKNMRNTLTPVFTGAKMRAMFYLIKECCAESVNYLRSEIAKDKSLDVELKSHFTRFSNDVIASTAFGLSINSYENKDNMFYQTGKTVTKVSGIHLIKFLMLSIAPKLMTIFKIKLISDHIKNYFMGIVLDAMKIRERKNIIRPDMIHLLMEAKRENTRNSSWSDEEIVAQCFIFFFAAFENNANLICTTCHELMENPKIQQRLYEEVIETHVGLNGEALTYDALNTMKYMDMVVSESLRKWPLAPVINRVCVKDYILCDTDGNEIAAFKPGDNIWIPAMGIHHDPDNFENPSIFDPERFSDCNKLNIRPFSYLPFGVGPRNCIGNRYAFMVVKAMLYHLLMEYKIERSDKTVKNLLESLRGIQFQPNNGFWVKLVPRTKPSE